jgi:nickel-type superoxide dismutase maturation protease
MVPLLQPGDEVLINPTAYRHRRPQSGDLVVAQHPQRPHISLIKWVVYGDERGYFLKGINTIASTDSRHFGWVPRPKILGQVVCRFP